MATLTGYEDPLQAWIKQMLLGSLSENLGNAAPTIDPAGQLLMQTHIPGFEASKWGDAGYSTRLNKSTEKPAPKTDKPAEKMTTPPAGAAPAAGYDQPYPALQPTGYQGITPELEDRIRSKARWNAMAGISPGQTVAATLALENAKKSQWEDQMFATTMQKYAKANVNDPNVQRAIAMDMITTGGDRGMQYGTQILMNLNQQARMRETMNLQVNKQMELANTYGKNLQIMRERPGTPEAQMAFYQNEGLRAMWKTDEFTLAQRTLANPQMAGALTFMPEIGQTVEGMRGRFEPETKLPKDAKPPAALPAPTQTPAPTTKLLTFDEFVNQTKQLNPGKTENLLEADWRKYYMEYKKRQTGAK